jgi:predicted HAD superfamily hydrolase
MNNNKIYRNILVKHNPAMLEAAELNRQKYGQYSQTLTDVSSYVVGPVLFDYVVWILKEAEKNNIKRLYFLARDGFIPCEIAKKICSAWKISIDCRYIYCSRLAWRYPQYHLMQKKSLDYICWKNVGITLKSFTDRLLLSDNKAKEIQQLLGFADCNTEKKLSVSELQYLKKNLSNTPEALNIIFDQSRAAYKDTMEYLRQEGFLDSIPYAIVDTGWTGSMQVTLNQLLHEVHPISVPGFYFGLFSYTATNETYFSYLFSPLGKTVLKALFNNNVIECICSAPTGTTLGYKNEKGTYIPVLSSVRNPNCTVWVLQEHITRLLSYTDIYLQLCKDHKSLREQQIHKKMSEKLLSRFIAHPTYEEATLYGSFCFSDDMTEHNLKQLAELFTNKDAFRNDFFPRLTEKKITQKATERTFSHWIYGSIRRSPIMLKKWHWLNAFVANYCKYLFHIL